MEKKDRDSVSDRALEGEKASKRVSLKEGVGGKGKWGGNPPAVGASAGCSDAGTALFERDQGSVK